MTSGVPLDGSTNPSWFAIGHSVSTKQRKKIGNSQYHKSRRSLLSNIRRSIALKGKKKSKEHIEKLSGNNHWNWKGGKSQGQNLRHTIEYDIWRKQVYLRDHYTYQDCSQRFRNLVAHHIKSFADFLEFRYDVNNGITLCRSCHKKRHSNIGLETRFPVNSKNVLM